VIAVGRESAEAKDVVIYRTEDGQWWVRDDFEFNDGRFQPLPEPTQ
jgi:hypothetical protein